MAKLMNWVCESASAVSVDADKTVGLGETALGLATSKACWVIGTALF